MRVEELLTGRDHVLVAFDGPVAELPSTRAIAGRLLVMVAEARPPRRVARSGDPFAVLAHAASIGPSTEQAVYLQLCRLEAELIFAARVTPGVEKAFAVMAAAGTRITVVSSLAVEAVRAFLVLRGLAGHVRCVAGRIGPDLARLPPAPGLITAAVAEQAVPAESCLFVGTEDRDRAAARAAGVEVLRYRPLVDALAVEPPPVPPNPWFEGVAGTR
jgi:phosphoglycolate phosphatase-like HAD superfamily hydrolase